MSLSVSPPPLCKYRNKDQQWTVFPLSAGAVLLASVRCEWLRCRGLAQALEDLPSAVMSYWL